MLQVIHIWLNQSLNLFFSFVFLSSLPLSNALSPSVLVGVLSSGRSCLFPFEDGFLDDGHGDPSLTPGLNSPTRCQNGERMERYSRKVFVGGLPPDIDEGELLPCYLFALISPRTGFVFGSNSEMLSPCLEGTFNLHSALLMYFNYPMFCKILVTTISDKWWNHPLVMTETALVATLNWCRFGLLKPPWRLPVYSAFSNMLMANLSILAGRLKTWG